MGRTFGSSTRVAHFTRRMRKAKDIVFCIGRGADHRRPGGDTGTGFSGGRAKATEETPEAQSTGASVSVAAQLFWLWCLFWVLWLPPNPSQKNPQEAGAESHRSATTVRKRRPNGGRIGRGLISHRPGEVAQPPCTLFFSSTPILTPKKGGEQAAKMRGKEGGLEGA